MTSNQTKRLNRSPVKEGPGDAQREEVKEREVVASFLAAGQVPGREDQRCDAENRNHRQHERRETVGDERDAKRRRPVADLIGRDPRRVRREDDIPVDRRDRDRVARPAGEADGCSSPRVSAK